QGQVTNEANERTARDNAIIDDYRNRDTSLLQTMVSNVGGARVAQAGTGTISNFTLDATTGRYVANVTITLNGNFNVTYPMAVAASLDAGGVVAMVNNVGSNYFQ